MENPEPLTIEKELRTPTDNESNIILEEVKDYHKKQIYIITKKFQSKIPSILSYLQNFNNDILNKIHIIKYLISLIQNIPYN